MIKHIILFTVLFTSLSFSQHADSLRNIARYDTTRVDSLKAADSLQTGMITPVKDSIVTIQGEPLSETSSIINKETFLFNNYRYTGDFLRSFPFNFVRDLGLIGQPHETFVYGIGNGGISYLQDGILWNNRYTNSLDLNFIQSEDIDSIEIVPSPRAFLYGPYNNPVAVNFITRDFISKEPYSRIKYYEGPDGEAMIDGKFNAHVLRRWNLSFQGTNRIVDETYRNSEFSIWQANVKLKYFLSNSLNFSGAYYFVSSNQGLNGGVDVDSIRQLTADVNSILYDPQQAPVVSPNYTFDVTQHSLILRTLAKPYDESKLDLSLYYKYNLDELRDVQDSVNITEDIETKTFGSSLNYFHNLGIVSFNILGVYESNNTFDSNPPLVLASGSFERDYNYFAAGGIISFKILNNFICPSFFYKFENVSFEKNYFSYVYYPNTSKSGFGFDLQLYPVKNLSLYAGYSFFDQFDENFANLFEVGGKFKSENYNFDLKYFDKRNFISYYLDIPWWFTYEIGNVPQTCKGIGFIFSYKLLLFLLEGNLSHYFDFGYPNFRQLPDLQFAGGIYVNDTFFKSNLYLKTGFVYYYTGESVQSFHYAEVPSSNKLDFSLVGEIGGVAIVYFIWENLFGEQYYIIPYYPMPGRNIRFGLSWEIFN